MIDLTLSLAWKIGIYVLFCHEVNLGFDIFVFCSEDFKVLRQQIIDMIMATEMKQHFEHLSKFDNSLNNRGLTHDDTGSMVCLLL